MQSIATPPSLVTWPPRASAQAAATRDALKFPTSPVRHQNRPRPARVRFRSCRWSSHSLAGRSVPAIRPRGERRRRQNAALHGLRSFDASPVIQIFPDLEMWVKVRPFRPGRAGDIPLFPVLFISPLQRAYPHVAAFPLWGPKGRLKPTTKRAEAC